MVLLHVKVSTCLNFPLQGLQLLAQLTLAHDCR